MKIIECPRDAMQGLHQFIPTAKKVAYLNALLKIGYDTIDAGSFVSPKAIPQLSDTLEVFWQIDPLPANTKLLAIIANIRGANEAAQVDNITYLGFPFSVSEIFQKRNTNVGIAQALEQVDQMAEICDKAGKQLLVYLSMAFGNPYQEAWTPETTIGWAEQIKAKGVKHMAIADTIGAATEENIATLFANIIPSSPGVEISAHFHSRPDNWLPKIEAAYANGCRRFDTAISGLGGCPMAEDVLVGNIATENLLDFAKQQNIETGLNQEAFKAAQQLAALTFPIN